MKTKDTIIFILVAVVLLLGYLFITSQKPEQQTELTQPETQEQEPQEESVDGVTEETTKPTPSQTSAPVTSAPPAPVTSNKTDEIVLLTPKDGDVWKVGEREEISWYDTVPRKRFVDTLFVVTLRDIEDDNASSFEIVNQANDSREDNFVYWKVGHYVTGGINSEILNVEPGLYSVKVHLGTDPSIISNNDVVVEIVESDS